MDSIVRVDSAAEHAADSELLLPPHHDLVHLLSSLEGGHLPLQASRPASESGWTTALLDARSDSRTYELQMELQKNQLALDGIRNSMSWRVTKPLRSLTSAFSSVRSNLSKP